MAPYRIILDSGAVSALAQEKGSIRVALQTALREGAHILIPTPVITESTTGNGVRDARTNRVIKAADLLILDEPVARAAATLRHRTRSAGTIDAMVVAFGDAVPGSIILTGDVRDLQALATYQNKTTIIDISDLLKAR